MVNSSHDNSLGRWNHLKPQPGLISQQETTSFQSSFHTSPQVGLKHLVISNYWKLQPRYTWSTSPPILGHVLHGVLCSIYRQVCGSPIRTIIETCVCSFGGYSSQCLSKQHLVATLSIHNWPRILGTRWSTDDEGGTQPCQDQRSRAKLGGSLGQSWMNFEMRFWWYIVLSSWLWCLPDFLKIRRVWVKRPLSARGTSHCNDKLMCVPTYVQYLFIIYLHTKNT